MIVDKKSWHYWIYKKVSIEENLNNPVSVCGYWSAIIIKSIAFTLVGIPIMIIMAPIMWAVDKAADFIESKCKGKTICPHGMVEFKD